MGKEKLTKYEDSFVNAARSDNNKAWTAAVRVGLAVGFLFAWRGTRLPDENAFLLAVVILTISVLSLLFMSTHRIWLNIYEKATKE